MRFVSVSEGRDILSWAKCYEIVRGLEGRDIFRWV